MKNKDGQTKLKILRYYEKLWIAAFICALVVTAVNFIKYQVIDYRVYFPFFCGIFCITVYYVKRNHRIFLENFRDKQQEAS